ncbi:hypothetical protein BC939DRAFT_439569 [Gamsiella multidivaricata]|uniref:uncharacterized protein n=1 Tax=Gamsiella multidivaricata TaxID=101098 RepID=UPI00221F5BF3|nr:uncharacterized protein BC939DRAFT_439569 [Gamsiella multidivaricata]KAG0368698.1 hypothetical protein BGZ54_001340 [Gamsiella multidivaricata]KAI7830508.1 hypothetical protein BC939DRAFT_439569 [Gamsiella multidivaricata]
MELMKENQPAPLDVAWNNGSLDGLDLLLKAATKTAQAKEPGMKKPKAPSMALNGSYDAPVIVGRGSQATLNLGRINKQVSRRHAIVQWSKEASAFQITVLGQNGVRINGIGYPSGQQTTLREGDIVDLVGVKMRFFLPAGPAPAQAHLNFEDQLVQADESDPFLVPAGLSTPKRTNTIMPAHQLATPTYSSPIRDPLSSPSQLTPTARMRHKILKYDYSPITRNPFDSPSSDTGNEFGSSPVKSKPIFALDTSPVRRPAGLESPISEGNIFFDDEPPKSPSKYSAQRAPLAPLSLIENGQSTISRPQTAINRSATGLPSQTASALIKAKPSNVLKMSASLKSGNTETNSAKLEKTMALQSITQSMDAKENVRPGKSADNVSNKSRPSSSPTKAQHVKLVSKDSTSPVKKASEKSSTEATKKASAKISTDTIKRQQKEKKEVKGEEEKAQENDENVSLSSPETPANKSPMDYTEMIIDTLVFARKKKSMTLSELFDEMVASQPSLMATHEPEEIKEQMMQCLTAARCVGKITRKGKDAYNKPLENQWYYIPECDHNVMRKLTRQEVMPSARKCTLKDKQYFFKMPPKLPYHRKSTSPYAVKPSARRTKESSKLSAGADDNDVSSSSSEPEDEADEPVQATRKRKMANSEHVDKKRKDTQKDYEKEQEEGDGDDDDEEIDAHNDSLDDLSELSGLSD